MAELIVVVEILIAERNADNPLHHQRFDRMLGVGRIAAVLETGRQAMGQPQHPIRGPQQQGTGVAGEGATIEGRNNRASVSRCKRKQVRVTLCWHRGPPLLRDKALSQKNFRSFRAPMHLTLVRDAGPAARAAGIDVAARLGRTRIFLGILAPTAPNATSTPMAPMAFVRRPRSREAD